MKKVLFIAVAVSLGMASCTGVKVKKMDVANEAAEEEILEDSMKLRVVDLVKSVDDGYIRGMSEFKVEETVNLPDSVYTPLDMADKSLVTYEKMKLAGMYLTDYAAKKTLTGKADTVIFQTAVKLLGESNLYFNMPVITEDMSREEKDSLWVKAIMEVTEDDVVKGSIDNRIAMFLGMQIELGHFVKYFRTNHSTHLVLDNDAVNYYINEKAHFALVELYDIVLPHCSDLETFNPIVNIIRQLNLLLPNGDEEAQRKALELSDSCEELREHFINFKQ